MQRYRYFTYDYFHFELHKSTSNSKIVVVPRLSEDQSGPAGRGTLAERFEDVILARASDVDSSDLERDRSGKLAQ